MPGTLCNVVGTLKDSGGQTLSGKLIVTLDNNLNDETTNPDSLLLQHPREYTITNGVVNVPLLETQSQELTYFFQFFRLVSAGVFDSKPLFDFHAEVPDVASVEIATLSEETGITTTNLSTGSVKVAREILKNPSLAPLIFSGAQIFRSETPPDPLLVQSGALWQQPSRGITWRWDAGRAKWKTNARELQVGGRNQSASALLSRQVSWIEFPSIVLERIDFKYVVLTAPNDGTNRWNIQAGYQSSTSDSLVSLGAALLTNANAPGTIVRSSLILDSLLLPSVLDSFGVQLTKSGSPGNLNASLTYTFSYLRN
jgi:hypothetical protein